MQIRQVTLMRSCEVVRKIHVKTVNAGFIAHRVIENIVLYNMLRPAFEITITSILSSTGAVFILLTLSLSS